MERLLGKSTKWFRNLSSAIICFISFTVVASDRADVATEYQLLSKQYEQYYVNSRFDDAMEVALKQLNMDPSDSVAFLRLALSIRGSCDQVKPYYSQYGSMDQFKDVTVLARMIIRKECGVDL
ncbi:hypothetical protein EDI28_25975 [Photobacterium chitinilyticum]|uniref:Uncharacterized protein n=2 Tax=Photobacterium chitinilyticum TaxID=2485123 RepID=A0A444JHV8_9GAMM|nr:hypothetical protein EDI28_25975 [Photobacterium chitinilyticum]